MSQQEQSGKQPVRKLGRGLSALLGAPVQVRVPNDPATGPGAARANPTPEGAVPSASAGVAAQSPTVSGVGATARATPVNPPEMPSPRSIAPAAPVEIPAIVPRGPVAPSSPTRDAGFRASQAQGGLRELPVEQIVPNRRQPRTDFDEASLQALAASIRQAGVMQPIMVRPSEGGFELVAGERRWRAAKLVGLATIPAVVRPMDDRVAAELALIENIQREDLNPMERAIALRRLAIDFELTHQEIADRVGLDRASVSNLLRLSDLDRATADLVRAGRLSQGHAKALLGISDLTMRASLVSRCLSEDWSVRALEREVQKALQSGTAVGGASTGDPTKVSARDANVADLERQLAEHLGTRVSLQLGRKKGSGRLVVEFYNLDQFDGLMHKMGFGTNRKA